MKSLESVVTSMFVKWVEVFILLCICTGWNGKCHFVSVSNPLFQQLSNFSNVLLLLLLHTLSVVSYLNIFYIQEKSTYYICPFFFLHSFSLRSSVLTSLNSKIALWLGFINHFFENMKPIYKITIQLFRWHISRLIRSLLTRTNSVTISFYRPVFEWEESQWNGVYFNKTATWHKKTCSLLLPPVYL